MKRCAVSKTLPSKRASARRVTAIGALSSAKLAFFDWETKQYRPIPVEEQVEVASLVGDIAVGPSGKPSVHVHAVLGRRDGTALAGHLQEGHVRPTLEIIVTESPSHLCKVKDPESGLALISARDSQAPPGDQQHPKPWSKLASTFARF
jgi:predicted DNA-binding protein with PD1-like motif